jgi:hypothetical protein
MLVSGDGLLIDYNRSAQTVFGWLVEKTGEHPFPPWIRGSTSLLGPKISISV